MRNNGITNGKALLDMNVEGLPFLVKDLFHKTGLAVIAGPSDCGKSMLLRQLAVSIVLGKETFLEKETGTRYKKAIYVSTEDAEEALSYMLNKYQYRDEEKEAMKNLTFILDTDNLPEKLDDMLQSGPVDLIVVDTFTDLFPGDINMANKVRNYLQPFSNIAHKYGCLVVFVHHLTKKSMYNTPDKKNLAGSHGIEAKSRVVYDFRKDYANPDLRQLSIIKGNYFSDEHKKIGYKIRLNENLTFDMVESNTSLSKGRLPQVLEARNAAIARVHELVEEGNSYEKTALIMKQEGFETISASTVGNYMKKHPRPTNQSTRDNTWLDEEEKEE